jgi:outer membrane receptor protein involved in Fe transport
LKPQPAAAPTVQTAKFAIGKADYQVNTANRLTARWIRFHNDAPYNSNAGTNTLETQTNFLDAMDSLGGQLVSTLGSSQLNELRVQYAHRHQGSSANSDSGTGPAVRINSPAIGFGGPWAATGQGNAGFDFKQNITQFIDNFTYIRAAHSYKFGVDWQHIYDERTNAPQFVYTFATLAAYQAAKNGTAPLGYANMSQLTGNLGFNMSTNVISTFVQDDWQISPTVKILYGVRYDLYKYPGGVPDAPVTASHTFSIDKNNFGPRAGVAWAVTPKTAVRASTGIMYDQPILGGYEQAISQSAAPSLARPFTFSGTAAPTGATPGAPAFPNAVSVGPTVTPNLVWTVDPNFVVARTWQANAQVEQAFGRDFTASVGAIYARGSNLPVVTNINPINPVGTLADGRPIYSGAVNAATRLDPRFNTIQEVQSIGDSTFKSLTLGLNKRFAQGLSLNVQYSLGKGLDNTPLLTQLTVQAEPGRSDPSNLDRDRGPNPLDIRHSFNGNIVYTSTSHASNAIVRELLTGNQIGVLLQFNSGLPVNILSNRDLNADGVNSDRPLNVARNGLYLPNRYNTDLRYTRWIPVRGSVRGEVILELKNVFNTQQMSNINTTIVVDALGNPVAAIPGDPYQFPNPSGYEQRKFQLGFKVRF